MQREIVQHGGLGQRRDVVRDWRVDGVRYGHILDPRTRWPVAGLASVTVFASRCLIAGSASTIALLHGAGARAWLDALGLPHARQAHDGEVECRLAPAAKGRRMRMRGARRTSPATALNEASFPRRE